VRDGWHHLVTGDESWFFLSESPRWMGNFTWDDVAPKPRSDVQTTNASLQSYRIHSDSRLKINSQLMPKRTATISLQISLG
jgi:hypothetical protein